MRVFDEFEYTISTTRGNEIFEGTHIALWNCGTTPVKLGKRVLMPGQGKQYEVGKSDMIKIEKSITFLDAEDMHSYLTNNGQTPLALDLRQGKLLRVEILKEKY